MHTFLAYLCVKYAKLQVCVFDKKGGQLDNLSSAINDLIKILALTDISVSF